MKSEFNVGSMFSFQSRKIATRHIYGHSSVEQKHERLTRKEDDILKHLGTCKITNMRDDRKELTIKAPKTVLKGQAAFWKQNYFA